MREKKLLNEVNELKNDLLETGRHENVYVVITSHIINKYRETKIVLNECTSLTIYPKSGSSYQIKYVLSHYFGLDSKQIDKILNLPSRWVTVFKSYPMCVLYSKGCYLI